MMREVVLGLTLLLAGPALAQGRRAAAAPAPASGTTDTYRISPGDQLDIYVWGDERLQRAITVLPDGTFAFPLAGTVKAAGRAPTEIEGELSKLLAPQYKGEAPQVTVSVKTPSGMQFSVIGKVRSPGSFSPTRYVNVVSALAMAGGPTDFADVGNVIIMRPTGDRVTVIRTRLTDVLKGRPSAQDLASGLPLLMAGDTVIVP